MPLKRKVSLGRTGSKSKKNCDRKPNLEYLKRKRNFKCRKDRFLSNEAAAARYEEFLHAGHPPETALELASLENEIFLSKEPVEPTETRRLSKRLMENMESDPFLLKKKGNDDNCIEQATKLLTDFKHKMSSLWNFVDHVRSNVLKSTPTKLSTRPEWTAPWERTPGNKRHHCYSGQKLSLEVSDEAIRRVQEDFDSFLKMRLPKSVVPVAQKFRGRRKKLGDLERGYALRFVQWVLGHAGVEKDEYSDFTRILLDKQGVKKRNLFAELRDELGERSEREIIDLLISLTTDPRRCMLAICENNVSYRTLRSIRRSGSDAKIRIGGKLYKPSRFAIPPENELFKAFKNMHEATEEYVLPFSTVFPEEPSWEGHIADPEKLMLHDLRFHFDELHTQHIDYSKFIEWGMKAEFTFNAVGPCTDGAGGVLRYGSTSNPDNPDTGKTWVYSSVRYLFFNKKYRG